jgi:hypothetical protein
MNIKKESQSTCTHTYTLAFTLVIYALLHRVMHRLALNKGFEIV